MDITPSATPTQDQSQPQSRLLQLAHELAEGDMGLVRLLYRRAHAEVEAAVQSGEPAPDFTLASERMSRSVRRDIMLADQLERRAAARAKAGEQRVAARRQIIRAVEDSIQQEAPEQGERLEREFLDRLDRPELEEDLAERPLAEIIAEIRHDLGLAQMPGIHPWKRRMPGDIALLCARAAAPRPATGPFNLPMPPGWAPREPLFPQSAPPPTPQGGIARIRGP